MKQKQDMPWAIVRQAVLVAALWSTLATHAATLVWQGGGGDWGQIGNWQGGLVPMPGDEVIIDGDPTASSFVNLVSSGGTVPGVSRMVLQAGDALSVSGPLVFSDRIDNHGLLRLLGGQDTVLMGRDWHSVLQGPGLVQVQGPGVGFMNMTIGAGQTIEGSMGLVNVRNLGTISASGPASMIGVEGWYQPVNNAGTLRLRDGATLLLTNTVLDNRGGTILLEGQGNKIEGGTGTIRGGLLKAADFGLISNGSTLRDVTLEGNWDARDGMIIGGDVRVEGQLLAGREGRGVGLEVHGEASLSGAGRTQVHSLSIVNAAPVAKLTVASDHVLATSGSGSIRGDVLNKGTIEIGRGGSIHYVQGAFANAGRTVVQQGATLWLLTDVDNQGGVIELEDSMLRAQSHRIQGGSLVSSPGRSAFIQIHELRDATLKGKFEVVRAVSQSPGLGIGGRIVNNGALMIREGGAALAVHGHATLGGEGFTRMEGGEQARIIAATGTTDAKLTIELPHRLEGSGSIVNVSLLNNGAILVQNGHLMSLLGTANLVNDAGVLQVADTGVFYSNTGIVQTVRGGRIKVDGDLVTPSLQLLGGQLAGRGAVFGDVDITAGELCVGRGQYSDCGALYIAGDLTLGRRAGFKLDMMGTTSGGAPLMVTGDVALGGQLMVNLGWDRLAVGDSFVLLQTDGTVSGSFDEVSFNAWGGDPLGSIDLAFSQIGRQWVATVVPEPATWAYAMLGLMAGIGGMRRHRRST